MKKRNFNLVFYMLIAGLDIMFCTNFVDRFIKGEAVTPTPAIFAGFCAMYFIVMGAAIYVLDTLEMRKNEK